MRERLFAMPGWGCPWDAEEMTMDSHKCGGD
jgi:hypothetical protein